MLTLMGDRYAWNRHLSVSVEIPLLWVVVLTQLVSRATARGWRLASWSVLGFEMANSRDGDLDTFGNTREIHLGGALLGKGIVLMG